MFSLDVEIFSRDACVERKDRNVEARHQLLLRSQLETRFLSYITTLRRQQTNQTAITGRVLLALHCSKDPIMNKLMGSLIVARYAYFSPHMPEGDVILNVFVTPF